MIWVISVSQTLWTTFRPLPTSEPSMVARCPLNYATVLEEKLVNLESAHGRIMNADIALSHPRLPVRMYYSGKCSYGDSS